MTPPKVQEQRKQEVSLQTTEMDNQASATEKLLNRGVQLWTTLEE